jgi:thiamine-phosphate pyrophosphorylase
VLPRLYAILDIDTLAAHGLDPHAVFTRWLEAGVRLVQLRAKTTASGPFLRLAESLVRQAEAAEATLIVNDRVDIARLSGAAGVHVGQTDLDVADVRRLLPEPAIVGLSTHTQGQLEAAVRQPVSYVAIGPVFSTVTKANPDPVVGLAGVRAACALAGPRGVPVVAIGGISLARAPEVIEAGATSVAVVSDLLLPDPGDRARAFLAALGDAGDGGPRT